MSPRLWMLFNLVFVCIIGLNIWLALTAESAFVRVLAPINIGIALLGLVQQVRFYLRIVREIAEDDGEFHLTIDGFAQQQLSRMSEAEREQIMELFQAVRRNPFMGRPNTRNPFRLLHAWMLRRYREKYLARMDAEERPPPVEVPFSNVTMMPAREEEQEAS